MQILVPQEIGGRGTLVGNSDVSYGRIVIHKKVRMGRKARPHLILRNWIDSYSLPLVCFVELAIFVIYILVGGVHQEASIVFTRDFAIALDDFFMKDLCEPNDDGTYPGQLPFYLKDNFLDASVIVTENLFSLATEFPCGSEMFSDNLVVLDISFRDSSLQNELITFTLENRSLLRTYLESRLDDFEQVELSSEYAMRLVINDMDEQLLLTVSALFKLDMNTNIILLDFIHSRVERNEGLLWQNGLENMTITFPMTIVILAVIALFLNIYYIRAVWRYTKHKAHNDFRNFMSVFKAKLDYWVIYAILTHIMSIIACSYYAAKGKDYEIAVPNTLILVSISSAMHCVLMVRYLRMKRSTQLITNVIWHGSAKMLQFILGCSFIYTGYFILGYCWFGTYSERFKTLIGGATALVCIIHGDSIKDSFDAFAEGRDLSLAFGVIYMLGWAFFSLTIMFNISVSIFEEALQKEILESVQHDRAQRGEEVAHPSFVFPIDYRNLF